MQGSRRRGARLPPFHRREIEPRGARAPEPQRVQEARSRSGGLRGGAGGGEHGARLRALASHLLRLVEELSPSVAVCVDTGHANIEAYRGAVRKLVEEVGKAIAATHISDNDGSGDQHLFPGRGTIRWGEVLAALDAVGYRKPLNLEIPGERWLCPDPSARVDYLKRLIASSGELLNPPKHRLS